MRTKEELLKMRKIEDNMSDRSKKMIRNAFMESMDFDPFEEIEKELSEIEAKEKLH